jgi:hypothetical protein
MVPAMIYDLGKGTPPDETTLPGMKVPAAQSTASAAAAPSAPASPSIEPTTGAAIPVSTRLRVTLRGTVDLQRELLEGFIEAGQHPGGQP